MALLLIAIPVRIPMKQNATHDYIVSLGSIKLHLCFSAMWELVGWGYQKPVNKFLSNFLYTTNSTARRSLRKWFSRNHGISSVIRIGILQPKNVSHTNNTIMLS
jgi:hypothetical protein